MNIKGSPAQKSEISRGIVIFIDIDGYLGSVGDLNTAEEVGFVEEIVDRLVAATRGSGIELIRTFGDGFLFTLQAPISNATLKTATAFLASARDKLAQKSIAFKASLAGGPFILKAGNSTSGGERSAVGPTANYAGKLIKLAAPGQLIVAWPSDQPPPASYWSYNSLKRVMPPKIVDLSLLSGEMTDLDIIKAPPASRSTSPHEVAEGSLELANQTKVYLLEMTKLADDKAKFCVAISAGVMTFLFNNRLGHIIGDKFRESPIEIIASLFLIITLLLMASAFWFGAFVLLPRTKAPHLGVIFFGSIVKWGGPTYYWEKVRLMSKSEIVGEASIHNFELAEVVKQKYKNVRISMINMIFALASMLIYFAMWDGFALK